MSIPIKVGSALLAWALIVLYAILMLDMINDVSAAKDAIKLDEGLVRLTTALGTGVVGVIAGLFGVAAPSGNALSGTTSKIGKVLTVGTAGDTASRVLGVLYVLTYVALVVAAVWVWKDKGTDLMPDFLEGQAIGAIGLMAACAVAKGGSDDA